VIRRRWAALVTNRVGGYVSSRNNTQRPNERNPMIAVRYSVHLHSKELLVMNPPTIGAANGPLNTAIANAAIATPRVASPNMSVNTAPTTVMGQLAKTPPKNRQSRTVWISFATATATWKIEKPSIPTRIGMRRPFNSDSGAPEHYVSTLSPVWGWGEANILKVRLQSRGHRATCRESVSQRKRQSVHSRRW